MVLLSGSVGANLDANNLYNFRKIWAGSYTLVALDEIYVDVWIDSSSPEIKAGIDLLFSDGTWMHDAAIYTDFQDQYVIPLRPDTDLKGWADDQWDKRKCIVPAVRAGKVVVAIDHEARQKPEHNAGEPADIDVGTLVILRRRLGDDLHLAARHLLQV